MGSAGILLGASGSDLALGVLQPEGAALVEVSWTCAERGEQSWERLKKLEDWKIFGPRPAFWRGARARRHVNSLRRARGSERTCQLLSHGNLSSTARRRRYWWEAPQQYGSFLSTGGTASQLARQR